MRSLKAPVLDQVHEMLAKGWLSSHVPVLNPFYAHRDEITVHSGCLMFDQSHCNPKTLSTSASRTPSRTSWRGGDEVPTKKIDLVAKNPQGNRGSAEDLLGLAASAG